MKAAVTFGFPLEGVTFADGVELTAICGYPTTGAVYTVRSPTTFVAMTLQRLSGDELSTGTIAMADPPFWGPV